MSKPAARLTDMHVCPLSDGPKPHGGGPISGPGVPNVLTGGLPQAHVGDLAVCVGPLDMIAFGSPTVYIGGAMAARMGDICAHGGTIVTGLPSVLIGEVGGGSVSPASFRSVTLPMGIETTGGDADPMAKAMIGAAKAGTPFAQQCRKG
jgi:uncharacterized Zn-binding protein involved in type VI secretion